MDNDGCVYHALMLVISCYVLIALIDIMYLTCIVMYMLMLCYGYACIVKLLYTCYVNDEHAFNAMNCMI